MKDLCGAEMNKGVKIPKDRSSAKSNVPHDLNVSIPRDVCLSLQRSGSDDGNGSGADSNKVFYFIGILHGIPMFLQVDQGGEWDSWKKLYMYRMVKWWP